MRLSLTFLLLSTFMKTSANVIASKATVRSKLAEIRDQINSYKNDDDEDNYAAKNVTAHLNFIETQVLTTGVAGDWGGVQASVEAVASQIPNLMSAIQNKDIKGITTTAVSMVGAIGSLAPPPAGALIGSITSIFTGLMGAGGPSMISIIQDIINQAVREIKKAIKEQTKELKEYITESRLKTLEGQMEGAAKSLSYSIVMLKPYLGETISNNEGQRIVDFANPQVGVEFMGELSQVLQMEAMSDPEGTLPRHLLNLFSGYVKLYAMRELMLLQVVGLLGLNPNFEKSMEGYQEIINEELVFLTRLFEFMSHNDVKMTKWNMWLAFDPENNEGDRVLQKFGLKLGVPLIPYYYPPEKGFRIQQISRGNGPWNVFFAKSYRDYQKAHFSSFPLDKLDRNGATSYEFPLMRTVSGKIPSSAAANELTFYSEACPRQHNAFKIYAKHNNRKFYWKRVEGVYSGDRGRKYMFMRAVTSCNDLSCCFRSFHIKEVDQCIIQSLANEAETKSFLTKGGRAFWDTARQEWIGNDHSRRHGLFKFKPV